MDNKKFHALLILIIPRVIEQICLKINVSEQEATSLFYHSKVYELLEDEKTAVWHFSAVTLCNMFLHEQETGELLLPEEI